jgi:integral membrane protein (TIGR01906 family)
MQTAADPASNRQFSASDALRAVLIVALTLLVPMLLVLGSIRLLLTEPYLEFQYNRPDFPPDGFGFTQLDRLYYGRFAIRYLLNGADISYLGDLKFPAGMPLFNQRELSHMVDVKIVVQAAMWAFAISTAAFVALTIFLLRSRAGRHTWRQGLMTGAALLLTALIALVVYILLDWDHFFDSFHGFFFADGTWTFEFSDTLIRLFPIRFWQDAAITVGVMSAAGAALIWLLMWRWKVALERDDPR